MPLIANLQSISTTQLDNDYNYTIYDNISIHYLQIINGAI